MKGKLHKSIILGLSLFSVSMGTDAMNITQDVIIDIPPMVRISGLEDILLDPYNATTVVPAIWYNWQNLCIYSNNGNQFELTTSGSGPGGNYQVSSGTDIIPFTTFFFTPQDGVTQVFNGTTATFTGASNADANCGGAEPLFITPAFLRTDIEAAPPLQFYTGTIFITVAPI